LYSGCIKLSFKTPNFYFLFNSRDRAVTFGQNAVTQQDDMLSYQQVVTERAHKIVATLGISDSAKFNQVSEVIAQQYKDLRLIHDARDRQKETAKRKHVTSKKTVDDAVKKIEADAKMKQDKLHGKYLSRLSKLLDPAQVDLVKDGMTYNALPITYKNYLDMIPSLKEEQKAQIWAWLSEARENAMVGGSSKEKLGWFGKYKGKITNYLTAAGYDLKKEEKNWMDRIKKEKSVKVNAERLKGQSAAIEERASYIVPNLGIKDEVKTSRIHAILMEHFDSLYHVFSDRKRGMQHAEASAAGNKELADARSRAAWDAAGSRLNKVHAAFLGKLSVVLTVQQNELLKDLMTEGGLQREYKHYLNLFPGLTQLQKNQVIAYLTEARENAMNAETAKDRTQWFIKYRGRANNFLSAAGYDLRKATEALELRQTTSN
jgi:hypothetical protein